MPGLPKPLPQAVSLPHDFVCEGTAWSASKPKPESTSTPNPNVGSALANRREW
jgi:hypothetical protein